MDHANGASHRFSVAPMLDYTDRHFRVLFRQISRRSLLYTEMVVAQALHHARREPGAGEPGGRLERLIGYDAVERPLALQLGGDDPQLLAEAARLAADWGYDEVNLNVGCPSEKVQKGRFGACLMADPAQVARCVEAMAGASGLPVTVKHRIGIDERDSYAELLAFVDTLAAAGCRRFTVHARKAWLEGLDPKQNRTIPPLRYELVHQLKADRPQLWIELNGGLQTLDDCRLQLQRLDGVMVGRAAYAHPLRWAAVDTELMDKDLVDQNLGGADLMDAALLDLAVDAAAQTGAAQALAAAARQTPAQPQHASTPPSDHQPVRASTVVRGLIPYAERWRQRGGRLWPIARHLVQVVEGVSGARHWRAALTRAAGTRTAGPEVLETAARQLEERGY